MTVGCVGIRAQISPGDLTSAHAHLEGIANCTKCHVLGDKVTNTKCLECHTEIATRIDQHKGFHSSAEVRGKDCFACHSEHHGRDFDIIRFDTKSFDHRMAGYELTGAHRQVDCRSCHMPENIASSELRKNTDTYLGLNTSCNTCHVDVHQSTLGSQCTSCHTTASFAPATGFDHASTDFPLRGEHRNVDCKSCHLQTITNARLMRQYANVRHDQCSACHEDPHDGAFGVRCTDCHNENSFHIISGSSAFNHAVTGYPLTGQHQKLDCRQCHAAEADKSNAFKDFAGKDVSLCQSCHLDVHENKFGSDCRSCHTTESFRQLQNPKSFNHALTGYPLNGKHQSIDCRACHEQRIMEPVAHGNCTDCHDDYHEGQFISAGRITDCVECHRETGFDEVMFTIDQHNQTSFPLEGAHQATPCIACHLVEEKWAFREIGSVCADCHDDTHEGLLDVKYYPEKMCAKCHTSSSWDDITFDHSTTAFDLTGRHERISCGSCHKKESGGGVVFLLEQTACNACHQDVHGGQFVEDNTTQCASCHEPTAWVPSTFDHTSARFKLEGAHAKVECASCHQPVQEAGLEFILYKSHKLECVDCHM